MWVAAPASDVGCAWCYPRETAASNLPSVKQIQAQFMAMDKDRSGMINLQELKTSLQQSAQKFTDDELAQLLRDLDLAAEGAINYLEFVAAAISLHQLHEEHTAEFSALARAAFDKFDIDRKGYVDFAPRFLSLSPIHRSSTEGSTRL